jgi:hypothetical protein
MHAVVVNVTVNDREAATKALNERVVPRMSQGRGFVGGYWLAMPGGKGLSVVVYESQDAASTMAEQVQPPPGEIVKIDSVQVVEVVASA